MALKGQNAVPLWDSPAEGDAIIHSLSMEIICREGLGKKGVVTKNCYLTAAERLMCQAVLKHLRIDFTEATFSL